MSSNCHERRMLEPSLRASCFDRVASLLISMLILSGASVAVLVVLWLATPPETERIVRNYGSASARRDVFTEEQSELDTPAIHELTRVASFEPTELSTLITTESVIAASIIEIEGPLDDSRPVGPPTPFDTVPRWERWEVRYNATSIEGYARQLDFFGIELGAVGRKEDIDYVSGLSDASPTLRTASGAEEDRIYFSWRSGTVQSMDRQLLQRAGVDVERRIVLQFYPKSIEEMLAQLELEHTMDGQLDRIGKTIFGIRPTGDGYEFFIIGQH
ncbi:MAG: hypothetical protein H6822_13085 [Planctomycetaceae bacterium]|nr:hypothetical protein [Planctomycetales bacterium]MCB9923112.1 hypothetical protein [Planctomycetaceae bacterium]